ncbi:MAG: kelch repeat-containing protein [Steroidobacteraceae bacterium]
MLALLRTVRRTCPALSALLASVLLLPACGGGSGGGGSDHGTAPAISNLVYSPTAVYVGAGGGTQAVHGEFSFTDPDGDVSSGTLEALDASGTVIDSQTFAISGASGVTAGSVMVDVNAATSTAGNFTVRVSLTDRRGLSSNRLSGTFRVSEFPWVARSAMPLPRREFATAAVNGRIYVLGGGDTQAGIIPAPATATVQIYDPASNTWSAGADMPVAAYNHAAAVLGGKIYVTGGKSDLAPGLATLQEYDPAGNAWTLRAAMPVALEGHASTAAGGLLYVLGGSSGGLDSAGVYAYDPLGNGWQGRAPLQYTGNALPVRNLAAVIVNGAPLVLGGYGSSWPTDAGYLRLVQQYDATTNAWSARADMGVPRADFAAAVSGTTLYVAGGGNWDPALTDAWAYASATDSWSPKTPMPQALSWPRAEAMGASLYVFDGTHTYEYTPANDIL